MRVLQLAPGEGEASGLAGYAAALRRAAMDTKEPEIQTGEGLGLGGLPLRGEGLWKGTHDLAERWQRERALDSFDVVHVEIGGGSYREYYLALEIARITRRSGGPPLVVTLHDPPFTVGRTHLERWSIRGLPGRITRRAWELSAGWLEERRMLSAAAGLITLSRQGARALERRFPGLSVPVRVIEHIADDSSAAAAAAAQTEEVGLLWLGFWVKGVGVEVLLEALGGLSSSASHGLPRWRLSIAGGIPAQANGRGVDLRRMAEDAGIGDRVEVLGHVPEAELDELFARHQILIVPRDKRGRFRRELRSVSGSMVRAMARGLAVVATDTRAAAAEVVEGRTGLLVPAGDVKRLARALEAVIADRELRARMGREAQAHVQEFHAPARVIADHLAVYRQAASRGSGALRTDRRQATG